MNRGQIRDLSRKRLGETTAAFWSDVELNGWIDDAGEDLAYKTKSIKDNGKMTTDGSGEYVLSTHFPALLSVLEVYHYNGGSKWLRLDPTSREQLDKLHPGWKSADASVPTEYYWDKEEDLLGFYVKANSSNYGTDYIHVYFARTYADITDDNIEPLLPENIHKAMADYVVATGYESRGYGTKANDAWSKYFKRIGAYLTERNREREDEELIMIPEQNL